MCTGTGVPPHPHLNGCAVRGLIVLRVDGPNCGDELGGEVRARLHEPEAECALNGGEGFGWGASVYRGWASNRGGGFKQQLPKPFTLARCGSGIPSVPHFHTLYSPNSPPPLPFVFKRSRGGGIKRDTADAYARMYHILIQRVAFYI